MLELIDILGNRTKLSKDARVACGYASFAQCWLLSGGALVGAGAAYSGLTLLPDVGLVGLAVFFIAMWPNLVLHAELAMLEGDADAARASVEAARGTLERVHDATGVLLLEEYFLALEGQMPNPAVAAAGDPATA